MPKDAGDTRSALGLQDRGEVRWHLNWFPRHGLPWRQGEEALVLADRFSATVSPAGLRAPRRDRAPARARRADAQLERLEQDIAGRGAEASARGLGGGADR